MRVFLAEDIELRVDSIDPWTRASSSAELDARFLEAVALCEGVLRGLETREERQREASLMVSAAMQHAVQSGSRVLVFERHCKWKRAYFEQGGADHPSDYVLSPDEDGSWRLLGIPKDPASFHLKRPLPAEWAGLVDDELSRVVGVQGARFCYKNRFIAAFESEASAAGAIAAWGLGST